MKKISIVLAAVSLSALMLTGCNEGITVDVDNLPTVEELQTKTYPEEAYLENVDADEIVKLGEYTGIEVSVEAVHADETYIENYISNDLANHPIQNEITDRAAQDGDHTNIDYVGMKGDVQFEGGTASNQELVLGSGSFIDGFEEGVIGMKVGETKDLALTFPEDYYNTELAGQDVVFTVTLNRIYTEEEAELNDAFVASLALEGVSTVEEYREYVYNEVLESDKSRYQNDVASAVITKVMENSKVKGDITAMAERYYESNLLNIQYQAGMYGLDLTSFASLATGMSAEDFVKQLVTVGEDTAKQALIMQAIANKEGITVSEEELQADLEETAALYGFESADAYVEAMGDLADLTSYRESLLFGKVEDFLAENAVVTDTEPVEETETAAE